MGDSSWRWYDVPIVMAGGALAGIMAGVFAGAVLGADVSDAHVLFWLIVPCQNLGHIGTLVIVGRLRGYRNPVDALGFVMEPRQARWVPAGAASLIPLGFLAAGLRSWLGVEEDSPQAIVEAAASVSGTITMAAVIVGVVIIGPVAEELLYRGLALQIGLQRGMYPAIAVTISASVFAVAHLADPSLYSAAGMVTLLVFFVFGLFLGVLRVRTANLGASIFAHSGFNLMTLVILYFYT